MLSVQLVWYKRDLRVRDHRPLFLAAQRGPVLPLFVVEPELLAQPDFAPRHWVFIADCLHDLRENLAHLGQPLIVRIGDVLDVFSTLRRHVEIARIWAHQETGSGWTYVRDERVRGWARQQGIELTEIPTNGVVRGLRHRETWEATWEKRMSAEQAPLPQLLAPVSIFPGRIPEWRQLDLARPDLVERQKGGETLARRTLHDFLDERGASYHDELSSPLTAAESCSRLSPYLTYGAISQREVVQALREKRRWVRRLSKDERQLLPGNWSRSLRMFESRLHWRDHFIQKLETEPRLEFENLIPAYDGLREAEFNHDHFDAWRVGLTGYPLVDACMRSLRSTGWLNFRMRAMLVSFAAHDLWLHWREPALHLARLFVDYEPGIHYLQMQMQSGTSGNQALRIYNPVKQSQALDPRGEFIRRWLPELAHVPDSFIHAPWLLDLWDRRHSRFVVGRDYPAPRVDHDAAQKRAKARIAEVRRQPEIAAQIAAARAVHNAPRRRHESSTSPRSRTNHNPNQLRLL